MASLGALLSGPAQLGLLSPQFIWARPIGLFGVSLPPLSSDLLRIVDRCFVDSSYSL